MTLEQKIVKFISKHEGVTMRDIVNGLYQYDSDLVKIMTLTLSSTDTIYVRLLNDRVVYTSVKVT